MFCTARIECVFAQVLVPAEQPKPRSWHDDVNVAAHRADGTIAVFDFKCAWQIRFEADGFAVASASMRLELAHLDLV